MNASMSSTPSLAAVSTICWASVDDRAIGFSHSTCLPAFAAAVAHSRWRWFGRGM